MKVTLAEAIKKVKRLNEEINLLITLESKTSEVSYRTQEQITPTSYDFWETRKVIKEKSEELIKIKHAINKANNETLIGIDDLTISDALIKSTLINKEINYHLDPMSMKEKLSSSIDYRDGIIYTELLYNPKECAQYVAEQKDLLYKIQIGIDRANMITEIEI